jgi:transcriptional regulator with XRE-family HTH domain
MARGCTQAELTGLIGLSARSNLSDYELGRRLPPLDLVIAIERVLELDRGDLRRWRERAPLERANYWLEKSLSATS